MEEFLKQLFGGCSHKELTTVQDDGFQYCEECGKAFLPPRYDNCVCEWKTIKSWETTHRLNGNIIRNTYIQQCKHCGTIKKTKIET